MALLARKSRLGAEKRLNFHGATLYFHATTLCELIGVLPRNYTRRQDRKKRASLKGGAGNFGQLHTVNCLAATAGTVEDAGMGSVAGAAQS